MTVNGTHETGFTFVLQPESLQSFLRWVKWKSMILALLESACSTASMGWGAHPCSAWSYSSSTWHVKSQKDGSSSRILRSMKSRIHAVCRIHPGWILQPTYSRLKMWTFNLIIIETIVIIIDTTRSILHLRIQYLVASTDGTAVLPTSETCSASDSKF